MIESIHLVNFQSHENNLITFDVGVNAIVGLSDSGKTVILRAFHWIVFNRPVGEEYLSHWAEEMSAAIVFKDGLRVERGRDKKGNYYRLNKQEFRAFKSEVPKEIQQALNLSDINLQFQMDSPFLLSVGPGEVAQILNRTVRLDVIDSATGYIRRLKAGVDRGYQLEEANIAVLNAGIAGYSYLNDLELDVAVWEQLLQARDEFQWRTRTLAGLLKQIRELQTDQEKYTQLIRAEPALKSILALVDKRRDIEDRRKALSSISMTIREKRENAGFYEEERKKYQEEFDRLMPAECPLCGR